MTLEQVLLSLTIAAVPAGASIVAAVLASRSATRARAAEGEAARLREAEERLAARRYDLYQPMLSGFGNMMLPGNASKALPEVEAAMPGFLNFATVWASDEALQAFFRFRIASGTNPPTPILMRLVADFFVAARVDLSGIKTKATGLEVIGMRVNDLYDHPELVEAFTMPFDRLASKHEWTIPWAPRT